MTKDRQIYTFADENSQVPLLHLTNLDGNTNSGENYCHDIRTEPWESPSRSQRLHCVMLSLGVMILA